MNESENEMPTNADQPTEDLNAQPSTPAAAGSDEAETLVIPTAPDTATAPTTPVTPVTPSPATPAEPWLSSPDAYAFPVRPVRSGPPPVRWGGIIWGILIILVAAGVLVVVSSPVRLAGVTVWLATLSPGGTVAVWVAALGIVIVVSALLGAISAAQRNRRRRQA